jgi:hypothetical protein
MKRFTTISLAVISAVLAAAMIVKSKQKWEDNADDFMKNLTSDVLIAHCGQPVADNVSEKTDVNRKMFYPTSKDKTIGLMFTFHPASGKSKWAFSSFHVGTAKHKEFVEIEDVQGSNSWALIELPCLDGKK